MVLPTKQNLIFLAVGVILVALLGSALSLTPVFNRQPNYSAVYLVTGDLYFGDLSRFPTLQLSNAHLLQVDEEGEMFLVNFEEVPWSPKGALRLSRDKIIWTVPLDSESETVQAMEGRLPPQQIPQDAFPPLQPGLPDDQLPQQELPGAEPVQ